MSDMFSSVPVESTIQTSLVNASGLTRVLQDINERGYRPKNFLVGKTMYRTLVTLSGITPPESVEAGLKGRIFGVRLYVLDEDSNGSFHIHAASKNRDVRFRVSVVGVEEDQSC